MQKFDILNLSLGFFDRMPQPCRRKRFSRPQGFISLSAILICFLTFACVPIKTETIDDGSIPVWATKSGRPKIVAVLPFKNETALAGLEKMVRESFVSHLSTLNFQDREIGQVDRILARIMDIDEKKTPEAWQTLSARNLGNMLRAELLFYGRVKTLKKYYFGIYAQIMLEVEAEIVSADNGQRLWRATTTTRTHEGGIPLDIFSVSSAAVRSGMSLQNEKLTAIIDDLTRKLVAEIPNPPAMPLSNTVIELQLASFRDEARAQQALKAVEQHGFKPHITAVVLSSQVWHRLMLGPYYSAAEADQAKKAVRKSTGYTPIVTFRDINQKSN